MAFESTVNTFPAATANVLVGFSDHRGLRPVAIRKNILQALAADDFRVYDWSTGEGKDGFAVVAKSGSEQVLVFRTDDQAARDTWLRQNASAWLGSLL